MEEIYYDCTIKHLLLLKMRNEDFCTKSKNKSTI